MIKEIMWEWGKIMDKKIIMVPVFLGILVLMHRIGVPSILLYYYIIGYLIVTGLASLHFLFNWKVRGQAAFDSSLGLKALKANATQFTAFKTTKPFHPIYNLLTFPVVSIWMMNVFSQMPSFKQALGIGILWTIYCLIFDVIFWIILPHPWRLTVRELFVAYQPWITLAYIAIFISPFLGVIYLLYNN